MSLGKVVEFYRKFRRCSSVCYYNTKERINAMGGFEEIDRDHLTHEKRIEKDAFDNNQRRSEGKKIAAIAPGPARGFFMPSNG